MLALVIGKLPLELPCPCESAVTGRSSLGAPAVSESVQTPWPMCHTYVLPGSSPASSRIRVADLPPGVGAILAWPCTAASPDGVIVAFQWADTETGAGRGAMSPALV